MKKSDWLKIKNIFHQTLALPKVERARFLADQAHFIRTEVSRLLETHEKLDAFIAEPLAIEIGLNIDAYIGKTIGNYKIVSLLGTGGMGKVFLAEKEGLNKKFALKIIKRGMDTEAVLKRFVRERQILSRLEHPNIAQLLDADSTEEGLPFFVMEYVAGVPVTKFCEDHQFDTNERLEIFQKICGAVKYAHQNLVVHRDLKPSNILVTPDGTPKLLDFGIAKLLSSNSFEVTLTETHAQMFTPEYASPEQVNGLPITTSTDVYSLGIVLYELLSGIRPFETAGKSYQEISNLISTQEPIRPSSAVRLPPNSEDKRTSQNKEPRTRPKIRNPKSLKGDLDNIILKSLRKESERRYQSIQDLSEDIRRYLSGLPVTATADSAFYRFSKFVGRNRFGTAVAALILILLGISIRQTVIANYQRSQADARFEQVRKLAKAVLFDYQDGIQKLPGSTAIREKMVNDSAEYLDNLAAKEFTDHVLQFELAKAYDRLGDVKGNFFTPSLGNSVAAKNFYLKALAIKQKLQSGFPNNAEYAEELAVTFDKLADAEFGNGNQKNAVENYQNAVALRENILQAAPPDQAVLARLAKGYRNIAVRGRTAVNTDENLELCEKAIRMFEELVQNSPENIDYKDGYADSVSGIPTILETNPKRRTEAVKGYQESIELRRQLSLAHPNNAVFRQKYAMMYSYLGDTFFELKKFPEAIENYKKCLEILDPMLIQDPQNEQIKQDHTAVFSSLAYTLALFGNTTESFRAYGSILKSLETKYVNDPTDKITHFRIGMAKEGLAMTYENFAKLPKATKAEQISALKNALSNYDQTLTIYKNYQSRTETAPTFNVDVNEAIVEVTTASEKCAEKLRKLVSMD